MENQKSPINYSILALVVIVTAFTLFLFSNKKHKQEVEETYNPPAIENVQTGEVQSLVNKNLRETSEKIEQQQNRIKIENSAVKINPRDLMPITVKKPPAPLPLEPAKKQENSKNSLNQNPKFSPPIDRGSPRSVIEEELANKQADQMAKEKFKREYIRQYIENAKKDGWNVVVDSEGNIKSVSPIKKTQKINIFNPTAISNQ
jgi:hypothetical protein